MFVEHVFLRYFQCLFVFSGASSNNKHLRSLVNIKIRVAEAK